jgi:hypothetical protein
MENLNNGEPLKYNIARATQDNIAPAEIAQGIIDIGGTPYMPSFDKFLEESKLDEKSAKSVYDRAQSNYNAITDGDVRMNENPYHRYPNNPYFSRYGLPTYKQVNVKSIPFGYDMPNKTLIEAIHKDRLGWMNGYFIDKEGSKVPLTMKDDYNNLSLSQSDESPTGWIYKEVLDNDIHINGNDILTAFGPRSLNTSNYVDHFARAISSGLLGKTGAALSYGASIVDLLSDGELTKESKDNKIAQYSKTHSKDDTEKYKLAMENYEYGQNLMNWGKTLTHQNDDERTLDNGLGWSYAVIDGIGQMIGMVGTTLITGGVGNAIGLAKYAPNIAMQAGLISGSMQSAGLTRDALYDMGMTSKEATMWGGAAGLATYLSENVIGWNIAQKVGSQSFHSIFGELLEKEGINYAKKVGVNSVRELSDSAKLQVVKKTWKDAVSKFKTLDETVKSNWFGKTALMGFEEGVEEVVEGWMTSGLGYILDKVKTDSAVMNVNKYNGSQWGFNQENGTYYRKNEDGSVVNLSREEYIAEQKDYNLSKSILNNNTPFDGQEYFKEGLVAGMSAFITGVPMNIMTTKNKEYRSDIVNRLALELSQSPWRVEQAKAEFFNNITLGKTNVNDKGQPITVSEELDENGKPVNSSITEDEMLKQSIWQDVMMRKEMFDQYGQMNKMHIQSFGEIVSIRKEVYDYMDSLAKIINAKKELETKGQIETPYEKVYGDNNITPQTTAEELNTYQQEVEKQLRYRTEPKEGGKYSQRYSDIYLSSKFSDSKVSKDVKQVLKDRGWKETDNGYMDAFANTKVQMLDNPKYSLSTIINSLKYADISDYFKAMTSVLFDKTNENSFIRQAVVNYNQKIKENQVEDPESAIKSMTDFFGDMAKIKPSKNLEQLYKLKEEYNAIEDTKVNSSKRKSLSKQINDLSAILTDEDKGSMQSFSLGDVNTLKEFNKTMSKLLNFNTIDESLQSSLDDVKKLQQQAANNLKVVKGIQDEFMSSFVDGDGNPDQILSSMYSALEDTNDYEKELYSFGLGAESKKEITNIDEMDAQQASDVRNSIFELAKQKIYGQPSFEGFNNLDDYINNIVANKDQIPNDEPTVAHYISKFTEIKEWLETLDSYADLNNNFLQKEMTANVDLEHNPLTKNPENKITDRERIGIEEHTKSTVKVLDDFITELKARNPDRKINQYRQQSIFLDTQLMASEDIANRLSDKSDSKLRILEIIGKIRTLLNDNLPNTQYNVQDLVSKYLKETNEDKKKEILDIINKIDKLYVDIEMEIGTIPVEDVTKLIINISKEANSQTSSSLDYTKNQFGNHQSFNEDLTAKKQKNTYNIFRYKEENDFRKYVQITTLYNLMGSNLKDRKEGVYNVREIYGVIKKIQEERNTRTLPEGVKENKVTTFMQTRILVEMFLNKQKGYVSLDSNPLFSDRDKEQSKDYYFGNSILVDGFGGSGKTTLLMQDYYEILYELKNIDNPNPVPLKVFTIVPHTRLELTHKDNLLYTNGKVLQIIVTGEDLLSGKVSIESDTDIFVIDEYSMYGGEYADNGVMKPGDLTLLRDKLAGFKNTQVLFLGDDGQVAKTKTTFEGSDALENNEAHDVSQIVANFGFKTGQRTMIPLHEIFRGGETQKFRLMEYYKNLRFKVDSNKMPNVNTVIKGDKKIGIEFGGYNTDGVSNVLLAFEQKYVELEQTNDYGDLMLIVYNDEERDVLIKYYKEQEVENPNLIGISNNILTAKVGENSCGGLQSKNVFINIDINKLYSSYGTSESEGVNIGKSSVMVLSVGRATEDGYTMILSPDHVLNYKHKDSGSIMKFMPDTDESIIEKRNVLISRLGPLSDQIKGKKNPPPPPPPGNPFDRTTYLTKDNEDKLMEYSEDKDGNKIYTNKTVQAFAEIASQNKFQQDEIRNPLKYARTLLLNSVIYDEDRASNIDRAQKISEGLISDLIIEEENGKYLLSFENNKASKTAFDSIEDINKELKNNYFFLKYDSAISVGVNKVNVTKTENAIKGWIDSYKNKFQLSAEMIDLMESEATFQRLPFQKSDGHHGFLSMARIVGITENSDGTTSLVLDIFAAYDDNKFYDKAEGKKFFAESIEAFLADPIYSNVVINNIKQINLSHTNTSGNIGGFINISSLQTPISEKLYKKALPTDLFNTLTSLERESTPQTLNARVPLTTIDNKNVFVKREFFRLVNGTVQHLWNLMTNTGKIFVDDNGKVADFTEDEIKKLRDERSIDLFNESALSFKEGLLPSSTRVLPVKINKEDTIFKYQNKNLIDTKDSPFYQYTMSLFHLIKNQSKTVKIEKAIRRGVVFTDNGMPVDTVANVLTKEFVEANRDMFISLINILKNKLSLIEDTQNETDLYGYMVRNGLDYLSSDYTVETSYKGTKLNYKEEDFKNPTKYSDLVKQIENGFKDGTEQDKDRQLLVDYNINKLETHKRLAGGEKLVYDFDTIQLNFKNTKYKEVPIQQLRNDSETSKGLVLKFDEANIKHAKNVRGKVGIIIPVLDTSKSQSPYNINASAGTADNAYVERIKREFDEIAKNAINKIEGLDKKDDNYHQLVKGIFNTLKESEAFKFIVSNASLIRKTQEEVFGTFKQVKLSTKQVNIYEKKLVGTIGAINNTLEGLKEIAAKDKTSPDYRQVFKAVFKSSTEYYMDNIVSTNEVAFYPTLLLKNNTEVQSSSEPIVQQENVITESTGIRKRKIQEDDGLLKTTTQEHINDFVFEENEKAIASELRKIIGSKAIAKLNLEFSQAILTGDTVKLGELKRHLSFLADPITMRLYSVNGLYDKYVMRHEAMHFISIYMLSESQRNALENEVGTLLRKEGNEPSLIDIYEYIADSYQYDVKNKNMTILDKFIALIKMVINRMFPGRIDLSLEEVKYLANKGGFKAVYEESFFNPKNELDNLEKRISNNYNNAEAKLAIQTIFGDKASIKQFQESYIFKLKNAYSPYSRNVKDVSKIKDAIDSMKKASNMNASKYGSQKFIVDGIEKTIGTSSYEDVIKTGDKNLIQSYKIYQMKNDVVFNYFAQEIFRDYDVEVLMKEPEVNEESKDTNAQQTQSSYGEDRNNPNNHIASTTLDELKSVYPIYKEGNEFVTKTKDNPIALKEIHEAMSQIYNTMNNEGLDATVDNFVNTLKRISDMAGNNRSGMIFRALHHKFGYGNVNTLGLVNYKECLGDHTDEEAMRYLVNDIGMYSFIKKDSKDVYENINRIAFMYSVTEDELIKDIPLEGTNRSLLYNPGLLKNKERYFEIRKTLLKKAGNYEQLLIAINNHYHSQTATALVTYDANTKRVVYKSGDKIAISYANLIEQINGALYDKDTLSGAVDDMFNKKNIVVKGDGIYDVDGKILLKRYSADTIISTITNEVDNQAVQQLFSILGVEVEESLIEAIKGGYVIPMGGNSTLSINSLSMAQYLYDSIAGMYINKLSREKFNDYLETDKSKSILLEVSKIENAISDQETLLEENRNTDPVLFDRKLEKETLEKLKSLLRDTQKLLGTPEIINDFIASKLSATEKAVYNRVMATYGSRLDYRNGDKLDYIGNPLPSPLDNQDFLKGLSHKMVFTAKGVDVVIKTGDGKYRHSMTRSSGITWLMKGSESYRKFLNKKLEKSGLEKTDIENHNLKSNLMVTTLESDPWHQIGGGTNKDDVGDIDKMKSVDYLYFWLDGLLGNSIKKKKGGNVKTPVFTDNFSSKKFLAVAELFMNRGNDSAMNIEYDSKGKITKMDVKNEVILKHVNYIVDHFSNVHENSLNKIRSFVDNGQNMSMEDMFNFMNANKEVYIPLLRKNAIQTQDYILKGGMIYPGKAITLEDTFYNLDFINDYNNIRWNIEVTDTKSVNEAVIELFDNLIVDDLSLFMDMVEDLGYKPKDEFSHLLSTAEEEKAEWVENKKQQYKEAIKGKIKTYDEEYINKKGETKIRKVTRTDEEIEAILTPEFISEFIAKNKTKNNYLGRISSDTYGQLVKGRLSSPLKVMYIMNHIFNYNINNIYKGDETFFKSVSDMMKRSAGIVSPITYADIYTKYGIGKAANVAILEDVAGEHRLMKHLGIDNKIQTDGSSVHTPWFREWYKESSGRELGFIDDGSVKTQLYDFDPVTNQLYYFKMSQTVANEYLWQSPFYMNMIERALRHVNNGKHKLFIESKNGELQGAEEVDLVEVFKSFANGERGGRFNMKDFSRYLNKRDIFGVPLRDHVIHYYVHESAFKSGTTGINTLADLNNFNVPLKTLVVSNENLGLQIVKSASTDIDNKTANSQMIRQLGAYKHNKEYSDAVNNQLVKIVNMLNNKLESLTDVKSQTDYIKSITDELINYSDESDKIIKMLESPAIDISVLKRKHIQHLLSHLNSYLTPSFTGISAVQSSIIGEFYFDSNGIATLDKGTLMEGEKRALTPTLWYKMEGGKTVSTYDSKQKLLDAIQKGEDTIKAKPAEVVIDFPQKDIFNIPKYVSLKEVMTVGGLNMYENWYERNTIQDGNNYIHRGKTEDEFSVMITSEFENVESIFANIPKYVKEHIKREYKKNNTKEGIDNKDIVYDYNKIANMVGKYYYNLNQALDMTTDRIPHTNMNSGQIARIVDFSINTGNTIYMSPEKNILDGSDYDIDELHCFFRQIKEEYQSANFNNNDIKKSGNIIFENIIRLYGDINNVEDILSEIDLQSLRNRRDALAIKRNLDDTKLMPNSIYSTLKKRDEGTVGRMGVGHFVTMQNIISILGAIGNKNEDSVPGSVKILGNQKLRRSAMILVEKYINAATDNDNEGGLLGGLGISLTNTSLILGAILNFSTETNGKTQAEINTELEDFVHNMLESDIVSEATKRTFSGLYETSYIKDITDVQSIKDDDELYQYALLGKGLLRLFSIDILGGIRGEEQSLDKIYYDIEFALGMNVQEFVNNKNVEKSIDEQLDFITGRDTKNPVKYIESKKESEEKKIRQLLDIRNIISESDLFFSYVKAIVNTKNLIDTTLVQNRVKLNEALSKKQDIPIIRNADNIRDIKAYENKFIEAAYIDTLGGFFFTLGDVSYKFDLSTLSGREFFVAESVNILKKLKAKDVYKNNDFIHNLGIEFDKYDIPVIQFKNSKMLDESDKSIYQEMFKNLMPIDQDILRTLSFVIYGFNNPNGSLYDVMDDVIEVDFTKKLRAGQLDLVLDDNTIDNFIARHFDAKKRISKKPGSTIREALQTTKDGIYTFSEKYYFNHNVIKKEGNNITPFNYVGHLGLNYITKDNIPFNGPVLSTISTAKLRDLEKENIISVSPSTIKYDNAIMDDLVKSYLPVNGAVAKTNTNQIVQVYRNSNGSIVKKYVKNSFPRTHRTYVSSNVIDSVVSILNKMFPNISIVIVNDDTTDSKGSSSYIKDGKIYINEDRYQYDSPLHEVGHIVLEVIKQINPSLYTELKNNAIELMNTNSALRNHIDKNYSHESLEHKLDEAITIMIGWNTEDKVEAFIKGQNSNEDFKGIFNRIKDAIQRAYNDFVRFLLKVVGIDAKTIESLSDVSGMTINDMSNLIWKSFKNGNKFSDLSTEELKKIILANDDNIEFIRNNMSTTKTSFDDLINTFYGNIYNNTDLKGLSKLEVINYYYKAATDSRNSKINVEGITYDLSKVKIVNDNKEKSWKTYIENEIVNAIGIKEPIFIKEVLTWMNRLKDGRRLSYRELLGDTSDLTYNKEFMIMNSLKKFLNAIEYSQTKEYVRYSELKDHPVYGSLYSDNLIGFDPIIAIEKSKGETIFSIYDIGTQNLESSSYDSIKGNILKGIIPNTSSAKLKNINMRNTKGDTKLLLMQLMANHFGNRGNYKIRNIAAIKFNLHETDVKLADSINVNSNIEAMRSVPELMDSLSPEMAQIFNNSNNNSRINYDEFLKYFWESKEMTGSWKGFAEYTDATEQRKKEIINSRINYLMGNDYSNVDNKDELQILLATLRQLSGIYDLSNNMNTRKIINAYEMHYKSTTNIGQEDFAYIHGITTSASMDIVNKMQGIKSKLQGNSTKKGIFVNLKENPVLQLHANKLRGIVVNENFRYFAPMFATIKDTSGVDRYSGHLLWTTSVKELTDLGYSTKMATELVNQTNNKFGNTPEILSMAKELVMMIENSYVDRIIHNRFMALGTRNKEDGTLFSNEDALKELNTKSSYRRGMLPMMNSKFSEGLMKGERNISKSYEQFVNEFTTFDSESNSKENENTGLIDKIADSFFDQIEYKYGTAKDNKTKGDLGGQYRLRNTLGLSVEYNTEGDAIYKTIGDEGVKNDLLSTDLESTLLLFFLTGVRKEIYEEKVMPSINATMMMFKHYSDNKDVNEFRDGGYQELIRVFVNNSINGKMMDSDDNGTKKIEKLVNVTSNVVTPLMMTFNMGVAAISASTNLLNSVFNTFGNQFSKNGMPDLKDLTYASGYVLNPANFSKVSQMAYELQIINNSEYEMINHKWRGYTGNKSITDQFITNWTNWGTDFFARSTMMIAQMKHDGSLDAYSLDKETGTLIYDENKDKKWETEDGKKLKPHIKEIMAGQGLIQNGKMKYGWDFDTMKSTRTYADRYIVGAYTSQVKSILGSYFIGYMFMKFRVWMTTAYDATLGRGQYVPEGGKWILKTNADGSTMAEWERVYIQGWVNTFVGFAIDTYKNKNLESWSKLNSTQKANMYKMMAIITLSSIMLMINKFGIDEEDKEKKNLAYYSAKYATMALNSSLFFGELTKVFTNPFALPNIIARWVKSFGDGNMTIDDLETIFPASKSVTYFTNDENN